MKTEGIIAAAGIGVILAPFSEISVLLALTMFAMVMDYITGITSAALKGELSSSVGIKGILKKVQYIFVVVVAVIMDVLISQGLPFIGVEYEFFGGVLITAMVCVWLTLNELLSIIENLGDGGVPMPPFLVNTVKKLKRQIDEKSDE